MMLNDARVLHSVICYSIYHMTERVVLLFDPERNELKNSFTKKKFTDVTKFLLITDMSVGPKFYRLPIFVPNSY